MTKNKPNTYWGIKINEEVLFRGTYSECWDRLCESFHDQTLAELKKSNVRIARVA